MIYKQISDDNRKKYGTDAERVLQLIINQYSDRTHFIYEILQNAEDAGATEICFELKKDKLCVYHNGRPFNERDIQGVCGIADGTKAGETDDGMRIGHFGIGFKSVYCYTEQPRIYSDQYHFAIKNRLFPEEIAPMSGLDARTTCLMLPFDKAQVSKEIAYKEIKEVLKEKITAESILILNNIGKIFIKVDGDPKEKCINMKRYPFDNDLYKDNVFSLSLRTTITDMSTHNERHSDVDYLLFTDANPEATAIIYNVEGKELKPVKNSKIYAFFPTAKEAHQNFYIHAPFDTTPARDNFKEGAEYGKHNIRLIKNIGELIWFSLTWMKDHGYLSVKGFNTVFPVYEYEEDDVLYGIYKNSIDIIKEEAILPTNQNNVFKRVTDVCMPLSGIISETFEDEDLRTLCHNRRLSWLAKEFSTESFSDIRNFLNNNFQIETLEWKDLVLKMDAAFLKQKDAAWMELLMGRIETYCVKGPSRDSRHYIETSAIPFVRTSSGEQICAKDEKGQPYVYLNNPDCAVYKIEARFLKNDTIRRFYQYVLGIVEYNIERETVDKILPKYMTKDVRFATNDHLAENIRDLKVIKDAIYANSLVLEKVRNSYVLTDGKSWYKPTELYLCSADIRSGYSLVKGIISIRYLSENYLSGPLVSMRLDEEFFHKIGCSTGLRAIDVSEDEYLNTVRKYLGSKEESGLRVGIFSKTYISKKLEWSRNFEGFPAVFANMTKKKSVAIAKFLNIHTMDFDIRGDLVGADDKQFSGRNVDSRMAYSMIGLQLCFEKWIYIEGDDEPHRPSEVDREDLCSDYQFAKRLMGMLPFKETKNALTALIDESIKDKSDAELVKRYLSSPEQMVKYAKAMAKSEAKEDAKNSGRKSLRDVLAKGDRKQSAYAGHNDGFEVAPISQKALDKRTENLDKILAESLDFQTAVTRRLSFSSYKSNKEEKLFLEQEYDGYCQVCLKRIKKHDGKNYFEAINILKYSELPQKLENSSHLGWNSLCLCPNCAAEYNYSSKKISDIYDQVMRLDVEPGEDTTIDIDIELPLGEYKKIRYSPRHFIALKEAFKIFTEED